MLKALLLSFSFAVAVLGNTQNLVPNPSFEDTAYCTASQSVYLEAANWFNPNIATPDIFECDLVRRCGTVWDPADPDVQASGYQFARTGLRFAGGYHWYGASSSDTKEYLMVKLVVPLTAGASYQTTLYYSRADGFRLATDRISVHFAMDSIHVNDYRTLHLQPHVELQDPSSTYLTENVAWTRLSGTHVATGGERYMVIGSFRDSSQVNGTVAPTGTLDYCYYYYDDISVVMIGEPNGIEEHELTAFQANDGQLVLRVGFNDYIEVQIVDVSGRLVHTAKGNSVQGKMQLATIDLPTGVYVAKVNSKERRSAVRFMWTDGGF